MDLYNAQARAENDRLDRKEAAARARAKSIKIECGCGARFTEKNSKTESVFEACNRHRACTECVRKGVSRRYAWEKREEERLRFFCQGCWDKYHGEDENDD